MCTEQLLPGGYPTAVKYIISYQINSDSIIGVLLLLLLICN